ncbi:hypothetical protein FB451DRAFT_1252878 [Mycena latifolia]|nr:hypothetical protein FB451DRAFT_1252878 [Mycena latifolia]
MGLRTADPISDAERVRLKAAANPAIAEVLERGLDGTYHYKLLAQPTLENHENVRSKWRDFTDFRSDRDTLDAEIVVGSKLPPEGAIKDFVLYLALGLQGRLTANATRRTVRQYICTFFACWARYANQHVSKEVRYQVSAFAGSLELRELAPLSTAIRPKATPTEYDLQDLIRFTLNDTKLFRTTRSKAQFIGINLIAALSGHRPGGIIESCCYTGSNECIKWKDVTFMVVPNPDAPFEPFQSAAVCFRNPKGHRGEEGHYTTVVVLMEPPGNRATCLVTILFYLALRDHIFADLETIEDILSPKHAPTAAHALTIKESAKEQAVFRAEVLDDNRNWVTSDTKALNASTQNDHLRKACFAMGYIIHLIMYGWRRLAANKFSELLKDVQRDGILTHAPGTHMFFKAYQSKTFTHDLGGILHGRGEDPAAVALAKASTSMSVGRDANAPQRLTVHQLAELDREPELVARRQKLAKLKENVLDLVRQLKTLDHEDSTNDDAIADLHCRLRIERKQREELQARYHAILNRERTFLLKETREKFHAGASRRQLTGEAPPSAPGRILARPPLADKTRTASVPTQLRVITSEGKENAKIASSVLLDVDTLDPTAQLCDIIYRFADAENLTAEVTACVNAFLGLPERPFAACYPGEAPTADEKCPVCKRDCSPRAFDGSGSATVGSHIHACLLRAQQERVQAYVEANYPPQLCEWDKCKKADQPFETRPGFTSHVEKHLLTLSLPPTQNFPTRMCLWRLPGGEICGAVKEENWHKHMAQVHSINAKKEIEVHYCDICPEWHVDELGDGLAYESHLWEHFDVLYGPFSTRVQGSVDHTPIGVEFTDPIDNAVEYQHGTGFSGKAPEFHGETHHGVALVPMHCPDCVYNKTLSIERRMFQFLTNGVFSTHVKAHAREIDDADDDAEFECPVPSCGTDKFTALAYKTHMIAYHRIPLCGIGRKQLVRRLMLPSIAPPPPLNAPVDFTHLTDNMDVDRDTSAPEPAPAPQPAAVPNVVALQTLPAPERAVIRGHCYGCSRQYPDIGLHLERSKCRKKNEYQRIVDGERVGKRCKWVFTGPEPAAETVGGVKPHRCVGPCRKQFGHIREHAATNCKGQFFRILPPDATRATRESGPMLNIAQWLAENPPPAPEPVASKRARNPSVDDNRGEGSSKRRRVDTPSRSPSPDVPEAIVPLFMCNRCRLQTSLLGIALHFSNLRSNSRCKAKMVRRRIVDSTNPGRIWDPPIEWDTWPGNPNVAAAAAVSK